MNQKEFDPHDYLRRSQFPHFHCPGCGHGIALRTLVWAIHELEISMDDMAFVSGIGCSGRLTAYIQIPFMLLMDVRLPLQPDWQCLDLT